MDSYIRPILTLKTGNIHVVYISQHSAVNKQNVSLFTVTAFIDSSKEPVYS